MVRQPNFQRRCYYPGEGEIENGVFEQAAVQSALIPALLGFFLTGAIRLANGRERGPLVASAAVGLTFTSVYFIIVGIPPHPPVGSLDKLVYGVAASVVIGFLLDSLRLPPFTRWLLFPAGAAVLICWLEAPGIENAGIWAWAGLGAMWLSGIATLWRLERERHNGINPTIMILIAALGLAAVAIVGGAVEIAHLAIALATALFGFTVWNWPTNIYPYGASVLMGAGGSLFLLAWIAAMHFHDVSLPALIVLLLIFFADIAARHMNLGESRAGRAAAPIVLAAVCCVPALAAVAIAYFLKV